MLEANEGLENIFENAVKEAEKRRQTMQNKRAAFSHRPFHS